MLEIIKELISKRKLLFTMAINDIKKRYLGSYLGILWAFIQPLFTLCVMWFVFSVGFKAMPVEGVPFILWLAAGMVPWFLLSEILSSASYCIIENAYLVNKVVFPVGLLPIIKIISSLMVHLFFIGFLIFMFVIHGYDFQSSMIQIVYYSFAATMLMLAASYITSSFTVFMKDFGQFIGVLIQFMFWATPIFWSLNMVPEEYRIWFYINPILYVTEGYREALIYNKWFWESPELCLYFWAFTITLLLVGRIVFNKLKPHFADVL
ncbi:MAG: ABC transporter permease [Selenomonadaceae bacterium]|nr:ABC transporter permease [Selenomonadaceae bacterium]